MAKQLTSRFAFLTDPKSRILIIGVVLVLIVGGALAINGVLKKSNAEQVEPGTSARLPAAAYKKEAIDPKRIDTQQSELRKTANEEGAKAADSQGSTFVATMRPDVKTAAPVSTDKELVLSTQRAVSYAAPEVQRTSIVPDITEQDIKDAELAHLKKVDEWRKRLLDNKTKINEAWDTTGRAFRTAYVSDDPTLKEKKASGAVDSATNRATSDGAKKGQVYARAGDLFYGTIEIGLNTDEPSAVTAYILSGPLKGGKLIGAQSGQTAAYSEKAVIQFTSLNHPKFERSIPVRIFAVDRDTKRAAVADSVDRHLLTKFGLAAAVDFAQGYTEALSQRGQTITYGSNGGPTTITQPDLTNRQIAARGVSRTMSRISNSLAPYTSRPNTIELYSSTEIGLLVAADIVFVDGVNADNSKEAQPFAATASKDAAAARTSRPQQSEASKMLEQASANLNNSAYQPYGQPQQYGQPQTLGQQQIYSQPQTLGQPQLYIQPQTLGQPQLYIQP